MPVKNEEEKVNYAQCSYYSQQVSELFAQNKRHQQKNKEKKKKQKEKKKEVCFTKVS